MRELAVVGRDLARKSSSNNVPAATLQVGAGVDVCETKALATALQCTQSFASHKRAQRPSRARSELLLREAGRAVPSASIVVMERQHIPDRYIPPQVAAPRPPPPELMQDEVEARALDSGRRERALLSESEPPKILQLNRP
jgi:hypothetical protein